MEPTPAPHYTIWCFLALGVVVGAAVMMMFLSLWRRKGGKEFPWWLRLVLEFLLGIAAAAFASGLYQQYFEFSATQLGEALTHSLFLVLAFELIRTAHILQGVERNLRNLHDLIEGDQRIITARNEPLANRGDFTVVGIEKLNSGALPPPLKLGPSRAKWMITISALRVDRLQDLLFSPEYLKHFLTLHASTQKQFRMLIVSNKPRLEDAVRSFLQVSEQMSEKERIPTYVYLKSEFYALLGCVDRYLTPTMARKVRAVMEGQPDLSLMRDESGQALPADMTDQDEYLLRYRDGSVKEFGTVVAKKIDIDCVDWICKILHAAIQEKDREGLSNLDQVLGSSRGTPWECNERPAFLQKAPRKVEIHQAEGVTEA